MIAYKLVTQDMKTRKGEDEETKWEIGKTIKVKEYTGELCSDGVIHAYEHPFVAMFMNPVHADIDNPRLFLCSTGRRIVKEGQLKLGTNSLKLLKEIDVPIITTEQRIEIAILCAKKVYKDKDWNKWADDWLSGKDRSDEAARAAEGAAWAEEAAAWAAWAAAGAAAWAAAGAARAAERAAERAAWAAEIDLISVIESVVEQ